MRLDPEPAAGLRGRPVGEDDQDRQVGGRPAQDLEQVARQRVDPVAVLEDEDDRLLGGPRPEDDREEVLERGLAELRVDRPRSASMSGDLDADERPRAAARARRAPGRSPRATSGSAPPGPPRRSSSSSFEQAPPDLAPDEVARVRPERLALAERDEEAAPARDPDELRDQAATCPCRRRPRSRRSARRPRSSPPARASSVASSSRRPTRSSSIAGLAAGRAFERAGQGVGDDRRRLALDGQGRERLPDERLAGLAADVVLDVDRADRRRSTSAGPTRFTASPRQTNVRRIAWPYVPLRSRPWAIPIWMSRASVVCSRSRSSSAAADGPGGVVLVGDRRPEHAVEVGALVAERQLEDVAAVAGHDPSGPAGRTRRACRSRRGRRRSRSRRSAGRPGRPAAARRATRPGRRASARRPSGRSHGRTSASSSGGGSSTSCVGTSTSQRLDDAERPLPLLVVAHVARIVTRSPSAASADGLEHDLALVGVVLGLGEVVDQRARRGRR